MNSQVTTPFERAITYVESGGNPFWICLHPDPQDMNFEESKLTPPEVDLIFTGDVREWARKTYERIMIVTESSTPPPAKPVKKIVKKPVKKIAKSKTVRRTIREYTSKEIEVLEAEYKAHPHSNGDVKTLAKRLHRSVGSVSGWFSRRREKDGLAKKRVTK